MGSNNRWNQATVLSISERLRQIRAKTGALTRAAVVEDARPEGSPLHQYFEWDDTAAAEAWRLNQAGEMIAKVQVVIDTSQGARPMRQWLHVEVDNVPQYQHVEEIRRDPELTAQVLAAAKSDLDGWAARYEVYKEFFAHVEEVRKISKRLPQTPPKKSKTSTKGPRRKK